MSIIEKNGNLWWKTIKERPGPLIQAEWHSRQKFNIENQGQPRKPSWDYSQRWESGRLCTSSRLCLPRSGQNRSRGRHDSIPKAAHRSLNTGGSLTGTRGLNITSDQTLSELSFLHWVNYPFSTESYFYRKSVVCLFVGLFLDPLFCSNKHFLYLDTNTTL